MNNKLKVVSVVLSAICVGTFACSCNGCAGTNDNSNASYAEIATDEQGNAIEATDENSSNKDDIGAESESSSASESKMNSQSSSSAQGSNIDSSGNTGTLTSSSNTKNNTESKRVMSYSLIILLPKIKKINILNFF